jgi:hypothetical protein
MKHVHIRHVWNTISVEFASIHACTCEFIRLDDNSKKKKNVFTTQIYQNKKILMDTFTIYSHHKVHKNQTIIY